MQSIVRSTAVIWPALHVCDRYPMSLERTRLHPNALEVVRTQIQMYSKSVLEITRAHFFSTRKVYAAQPLYCDLRAGRTSPGS